MTQYTKPTVLPAWAESAGGADVLQPSNAEIQAGWPLSNVPPSRKRFNWVLKYLAQGFRYLLQRGIPEWDSAEDYRVNDRVMGSDGKTYKAILTGINKDPTTQPTYWTRWGFTLAELNAEGTTPPQFDNNTSLATTAFVQRALGNSQGVVTFSAGGSVSLTAADSGKIVNISGTSPTTLTLPNGSTLPNGATFEFFQSNTQATTIQRFGTDAIYVNSGTVTAFTIYAGDSLKLVWLGAWVAINGTSQFQYSTGRFASSLGASGYQKLPSGMIIQWGSATTNANGSVTVSYPTSFPTAVVSLVATGTNSGVVTTAFINVNHISLSHAAFYTANTTIGIAYGVHWIAIGY